MIDCGETKSSKVRAIYVMRINVARVYSNADSRYKNKAGNKSYKRSNNLKNILRFLYD